jgi:ribosome maturation factor RimP
VKTALEVQVNNAVRAIGFDLVELNLAGSKRRPVIDVRIEREGGDKVTVDDCANVSRVLLEMLDQWNGAPDDYVLEVSSPGVERPLRRVADWRRFAGRSVSVLSPAVGGRREFEIVDVEVDEVAPVVVLRDGKGSDIRVPLAEVKEARLVFHWKR